MNDPHWAYLINGHLDDSLSESEHSEFETLMLEAASARKLFWDLAEVHGLAHESARVAWCVHNEQPPDVRHLPKNYSRWLHWRPLTAAAAGIVFGMFCTSVVYGLVAQRKIWAETLLTEGFEKVEMVPDRGVPSREGVWAGDLLEPTEADGEVKPAEGAHMVTLPPVEKRKFSYAFRFVNLSALSPMRPGQSREIEVTAQFHGATPGAKSRFQIRLAAFADDVAGAREIWVRNHVDEQALMHVAKTVKVAPTDRGWTTVRSAMDVPAGARLVLVSLAACVADSEASKTAHYLDDVQNRLITQETPMP